MMDPDFRHFLRAAQGEEPPISVADPRWAETEALARKLIAAALAEGALRALRQEPAHKKRWDLLLLAGLLHQGLGERAASLEALEVVGDKLAAAGQRDGIVTLLPRFLEPEPVSAAVRFLHFLAKGAPDEQERIDHLRRALAIRPLDAELCHELAGALERTGDVEAARQSRIKALEIWLDSNHADRLTEELLRTVEDDLPAMPARVTRILLRYGSLAAWSDAELILELALPEIQNRAAGLLIWSDVAPLCSRAPETKEARSLIASLLRVAVAGEPDPDAIVACSGVQELTQPLASVAARVPKILSLPPGAHVTHATWGLGRVATNDGESLSLEFRGRAGHRMSLAMASKSLDRLAEDGLRLAMAETPERIREWVAARDPQLVFAALRDLGGEGTLAQLKPRIELALGGADWAAFWKDEKEKLKSHPRLDLSEAYRQVFRIASEGRGFLEAALPDLSPRAGEQGIGLIRRFLREHPDHEERIAKRAAGLTARWAADAAHEPTLRGQALLYAHGWGSVTREQAQNHLNDLIEAGLSPGDLMLSQHQEALLDLARGARQEEAFLWRAIDSRLPRLRERGRARLRELLGEEFARAVREVLGRAADNPGLATRLIEHDAAESGDAGGPPAAVLLLTALRLLERDLEPAIAERLLALIGPEGDLTRLVRRAPLASDALDSLESTVLHWRGSERRLQPVLEHLRGIGHEGIADAYESRRSARAQSLLAGKTTEDIETRHTIMSRPTYQRLEAELQRLRLALRTTIPAAIEKARQLGDLRENAEYEAAKQRQATAAARTQELLNLLERTRLLETIEIDDSRAGVGTEVTLEPLDAPLKEPVRYWILGEGDHALGHGILSYRAPILRPLLGKHVGAEVELELPDGTQRFRVASIRKRVPEASA